jgi:hypothetical protein
VAYRDVARAESSGILANSYTVGEAIAVIHPEEVGVDTSKNRHKGHTATEAVNRHSTLRHWLIRDAGELTVLSD